MPRGNGARAASSVIAYIGLGSNLADPSAQVTQGILAIARLPETRIIAQSSFYRSAPMGPPDQPDYINAVTAIETAQTAYDLLASLQAVEARHGRARGLHWGPRTLDIDILLYGAERITGLDLTVPHPGLSERAFVLYPLYEIAPDLEIPGLGPLAGLLRRCEWRGIERLSGSAPITP
ncbi:MAG: 2-amino-4-hydroxy-6-hydroxymethyldihydropteridine pyrophosphokinase [Chromatiales bacterium USCg_Taylor]|nr:MAG: 2-amino-4-hydroxy-6-hydroxymethyldihydropteridine pyrophosphokinase [Chromatiales bacterium USCg_Taylor]